MMKAIEMLKKSFENTPKPTARVVMNDLVVSLPNAIKPCVWRTNLEEVKSALFEVDQANASYQLLMKTHHETKELISSYQTQDDAIEALNIISKALLTANSRSVASSEGAAEEDKPLGFFKSLIIFLAFFFVFMFIAGLFMKDTEEPIASEEQEVQLEDAKPSSLEQQKQKTNIPAGKEGVPLSAEDLLGGGQ